MIDAFLRGTARPIVLGHRGAPATGAGENTRASILTALNDGADGVEIDIRLTRDGHAVLSHDPTLARVAGIDLAVADATLAALQAAYPDLLTLDQALGMLADRPVMLDMKETDAARLEAACATAARHSHPFLALGAVNLASLEIAIAAAPNRPLIGLLNDEVAIERFLSHGHGLLRFWGRPGLAPAALEAARARGVGTIVITANAAHADTWDAGLWGDVLAMRPDALIVDDPGALARLVRSASS